MSLSPASSRGPTPETPTQHTSEQKDSALTNSNYQKNNDRSDSKNQERSSNDSKFDQ